MRRVKEGTSAVLLQSGLNESCGQILWNAFPFCETFKISHLMGRRPMKDVLAVCVAQPEHREHDDCQLHRPQQACW